ncbi:MAG: hypothetical protein ACK5AC_13785 [Planctomycetota bacterium]
MIARRSGSFLRRFAIPSVSIASLIAIGIGNSLHAQQMIPDQGGVDVTIVPAIPLQAVPIQAVPIQAVPMQAVPIQAVPIQAVPMQAVPMQAVPIQAVPIQAIQMQDGETRAETAQRWIRGFIQNELNLIEQICAPTSEQSQGLVDMAESQWRNRLTSVIRSYAETPNQRVNSDFELRVERLVLTWVDETLTADQHHLWQKEVESRVDYRKRIVIGRMVGETERRYGLTHDQMLEITQLLNERWKDSWWGMYRTGTLPETKFAWISATLSESQRTTGADRGSRFTEHYMGGGSVDMPALALEKRFQIGSVSSSPDIPLHPRATDEDDDEKQKRREERFDPRILPDIDNR